VANIGDLFFTLGLDDSKLIPDATKSGQAAGEAAGQSATKSLGSKVGAGLKTSFMGFGVAASGAFALATKGALELENVQVDLQRETGLSADEAKRAASAINGIAGRNVQDIGAVSAAFAKVHNDLGLTGDAAVKATEQFVRFGRATGQDAASAVSAFDDILDSFGLTADDAAGIMDKLVVSHQKFGGSIEENQAALSHMAPQLKALNLGLDDGIGLLNLFAASGLDASAGQKALNQAISKLPAGETMDQFLVRLSKVTDDGDRAQLAMSVFGAKAGAGLANAIKPGVSSLKDFEISAADAAGATDKAADVIDSSFSGRIKKAVSIAGASLRQFGADFGPALTGVASLSTLVGSVFPGIGSKIVGGLAGAIKGLGVKFAQMLGLELGSKVVADAASTAVAGAVTTATAESSAAGAAAKLGGSRLATAFGLGLRLGLVLAVAEAADIVSPLLNKLGQDIHDQVFGKGSGFLGSGFSLDDVPWPLGNKGAPDWAKGAHAAEAGAKSVVDGAAKGAKAGAATGGSWADTIPDSIAAQAPAAETAGKTVGSAAAKGAGGAAPAADTAGKKVGNAFQAAMTGAVKKGGAALQTTASAAISSVATGILEKQGEVDAALSAALDFQKKAKTRPQQAAHLIGVLTGQGLIDGLHDKNPAVRQAFDLVRQDAIDRLKTLGIDMNHLGKAGGEELAKALKSKDPAVRSAARALKTTLEHNAKPALKPNGVKGGTDLAAGVKSTEGANKGAARGLALVIQQNTKANTKPVGRKAGADLAGGVRSEEGATKGAARGLAITIQQSTKANTKPNGVRAGRDLSAGVSSTRGAVAGAARNLDGAIERGINPNTRGKGVEAGRDVGGGLNSGAARNAIRSAARSLLNFINGLLTINANVRVRATVSRNTGGSRGGSSAPRQHGGPVSPLGSYVVGERGPELFVPRVSGRIVPHGPTASALAGGGDTYQVNMTQPRRPETSADAMRELRRFGEMGLLPKRRAYG
jgi:hypothetical protein